jgi:hypothetical protein
MSIPDDIVIETTVANRGLLAAPMILLVTPDAFSNKGCMDV